ncbi:adenylyltransferase/cytidyltransferase family protein [Anderseniella sp. Alg231-50]|uniref:adenylyltransferase/cytidyltransferase family protein n=1 Tax=Anderseniella sp. Alg231-50 TaxID=1922226 RepID=UPI00307B1545
MADHGTFRQSFRRFARALHQSHRDKAFLSDGTLLGFVRENDFIAGDSDIDLAMFAEDYDASVIDSVARAGFVLTKQSGAEENGLSLKFHDGQTGIDLTLFYTNASGHHCYVYQRRNRVRYSFPAFKLQPAVFQGMPVMCPADAERMLEVQYGPDWRTPSKYWSYAFSPANAAPDGGLLWRSYFTWRRAKWKLRCMAKAVGLLAVPSPRPALPPVADRGNQLKTGIIFTDGVFDMLHANHVKVLEAAKALGEYLVVAVATDKLADTYKRKPVICEQERLLMVQSLACVDEAYLMSGPLDASGMDHILNHYSPCAVVYGGDATPGFYEPAERAGIMVRPAYRPGINSSAIIDTVLSRPDTLAPKVNLPPVEVD